jgi:sulfatase maturation enzyme AslB (radical SAM superfamily)
MKDFIKSIIKYVQEKFGNTSVSNSLDTNQELTIKDEILSSLAGFGDDYQLLKDILSDMDEDISDKIDLLKYLLEKHPRPHWVNYLLSQEEFIQRREIVHSFPINIWFDLASICNIECRFCKYSVNLLPKSFVTLQQVEAIEWLKFVRLLNLSSGTGESLTNPEFIKIFHYLRETYPHLHITLLTNGKALSEEICYTLRDQMDQLHISMNASNEKDYKEIIHKGSWEIFLKNLNQMKRIFHNSSKPKISASFVMMRWNIERAVEYLEFAADHGASLVLFHHYYTPHIRDYHKSDHKVLERKFPVDQSLYFFKDLSDRVFDRVQKRASELNVEVQVPVPFAADKYWINFGMRSQTEPSFLCNTPWMNMYLLWGMKSKREEITMCCGLAADIGVFFERDQIATKEGLHKVWNSPILQAYRRTVNGPGINPICELCRITDRFDPKATYPDQREFFKFVQLECPEHFAEQKGLKQN